MRRIIVIFFCLAPFSAYAFFCPTNFQQINLGQSIAEVTKACGAPTSKKEYTKKETHTPEEWSYFSKEAPAGSTILQHQATTKTALTFDQNGTLVNIIANGYGSGSTNICGRPITLGMTRDAIKSMCGEPGFSSKANGHDDAPVTETKIAEYTYVGATTVTLVFVNDKLTERK